MAKVYKEPCPCNGCTKRTADCHGKCPDYKEWVASGVEKPRGEFVERKYIRKKQI